MPSFNQVILIGNLTRDPELRVTPKGTSICQFGMAVNRTYKDEAGNTREEVSFFDIEAWAKAGETIAKFMTKGRSMLVQGRLRQDTWEDKNQTSSDGKPLKRSRVKIVVENFQFLGSRENAAPQTNAGEESFDQAAPDARPAPRAPAPPPHTAQNKIEEDVQF